jgi:hypothetical integral membrane protein (TIGR02206 family)
METLSAEHIAAIAATAAAAAAAIAAGRGPHAAAVSRALALVIVGTYAIEHATFVVRGTWELDFNLPLHLTDVVTLVASLALWTARPLLVELTYFWALTASLQAVLTPELNADFPSVFYWTYFITHGGAVVAAVHLVFGRRITPRAGAVWRAFAGTACVAAAAAFGDLLTGGNYMFLREKPTEPTLLDVMGPWPWYIATGAALALVLFWLLDLPFRRARVP